MKKKIWIPIIAVAVLLVVLFVPIRQKSYKDGGTREWTALTYKIVDWNRISADGTYQKTRVYFGEDRFKTIDELWDAECANITHTFLATVLEINGTSVTVAPKDGEAERNSVGKISFSFKDMDIGAAVGDVVNVTYTGGIMETYPAQINFVKWEISEVTQREPYTGEWLNKQTAEKDEAAQSDDLIITEIYSDCFFASYVTPMPYTFKINGVLPEEWCVGDQVLVTYNNSYTDDDGKIECDLIQIEASDFELDPDSCYKPVIYLYPTQETFVNVQLSLDGKRTCTYPTYDNGWAVTASPDGTLTDAHGQTYNYLYWEGETCAKWDMTKGFCVKGEDTAAFLEDALAKLGLNRREANEFIVFWLPLMQDNPYNIISFQTEVYTDAAPLQITPKPDTLIRVFMTYVGTDNEISLEPQELTAPERTGFTVVEWGGTGA